MRRAAPPKVVYPPELLKPLVRPASRPTTLAELASPGYRTAIEAEQQREYLEAISEKIDALAKFYDAVEEGKVDWQRLAIALSVAHVPAFQTSVVAPRGRGRPRKEGQPLAIFEDVTSVLTSNKTSVANACRILAKRRGRWHGWKAETLEARFHEAKRDASVLKQVEAKRRAWIKALAAALGGEEKPHARLGEFQLGDILKPPPGWKDDKN